VKFRLGVLELEWTGWSASDKVGCVNENVLGTSVCPKDFKTAAVKHGRHFARYLLAAEYAKGRRVLDAACGGGFGSAYLARRAESVLGVDLDEQMVSSAWKVYQAENLSFERHDLNESLIDLVNQTFNLVVSFETLEHVRDPARCLFNFVQVMSPDAIALVSVPNGTKELHDGDTKAYHRVHFSAEQFESLLSEHFSRIEMRSQAYRKNVRHYFRKLTGRGGHHAKCYTFVPGLLDTAKTWLAICRSPKP
jgi:2-polyprenyl-3-methyl-5-hydroxy-6-metoxy-1,4-benzoquinol methylase